ncbi:hypothetical protein ACFFVJ_17225, partial [Roseibium salinum]|uniref:hypothetical protein n=1 Tax=Roseibium salinum TaxID=1604349 RepID=UPI0035E78914
NSKPRNNGKTNLKKQTRRNRRVCQQSEPPVFRRLFAFVFASFPPYLPCNAKRSERFEEEGFRPCAWQKLALQDSWSEQHLRG